MLIMEKIIKKLSKNNGADNAWLGERELKIAEYTTTKRHSLDGSIYTIILKDVSIIQIKTILNALKD